MQDKQFLTNTKDKRKGWEQNEDCIYLSQEGYPYLAIVADGMGGHVAGQVASSRAVAFVRKRLEGYDLDRKSVV